MRDSRLIGCVALAMTVQGAAASLPRFNMLRRDAQQHWDTPAARGVIWQRPHNVVLQNSNVTKRTPLPDGQIDLRSEDVVPWGKYCINVTVGTPATLLPLAIDTNTPNICLLSSSLGLCRNATNCPAGTFNSNDSMTYNVLESSQVFENCPQGVEGSFAKDVVCIGDDCISDLVFALAQKLDNYTNVTLGPLPGIGTFGLGFETPQYEYTPKNYPTTLQSLRAAGVVNSMLFSIYLNDVASPGEVLFGGIDTTKFAGDLDAIDLAPNSYFGPDEVTAYITTVTDLWFIVNHTGKNVIDDGENNASASAANTSNTALPIRLDYTTPTFMVPHDLWYNDMQPWFPQISNDSTCPCSYADDDFQFQLNIANTTIWIPNRHLILPIFDDLSEPVLDTEGNQICSFQIQPWTGGSNAPLTLGQSVLRSMYIVFDPENGQINVAQAAFNVTSPENIITISAGPSGVASAMESFAQGGLYVTTTPNAYPALAVQATGLTLSVSTETSNVISATTTSSTAPPSQKPRAHTGDSHLSAEARGGIGAAIAIVTICILALVTRLRFRHRRRQHLQDKLGRHQAGNVAEKAELSAEHGTVEMDAAELVEELDVDTELAGARSEMHAQAMCSEMPDETKLPDLPARTIGPELPAETRDLQLPAETVGSELPAETVGPELPGDNVVR